MQCLNQSAGKMSFAHLHFMEFTNFYVKFHPNQIRNVEVPHVHNILVNMPVKLYDCGRYTFGITRNTSFKQTDKGKPIFQLHFQCWGIKKLY